MPIIKIIIIILLFLSTYTASGTISATYIVDLIKNGQKVDETGSIIQGDLEIENRNISSSIILNNCKIVGRINFTNITFEKPVKFTGSEFFNDVRFDTCNFQDKAQFGNASFKGGADFFLSNFANSAIFANSRFSNSTGFQNAKFMGIAFFRNTRFYGDASFGGSTEFFKEANFIGCNFSKRASFGGAKFHGKADFSELEFQNLDLTVVRFEKDAKLVLPDPDGYRGFSKSENRNIIVEWQTIKNNLDYSKSVYRALVEKFKKEGRFREADDCYYQYMHSEAFSHSENFFDKFLVITCGSFVRLDSIFYSSVLFMLIFGVVFCLFDLYFWIKKWNKGLKKISITKLFSLPRIFLRNLGFSIMIFFVHRLPTPVENRWRRLLLIVESIFSWLFLAIFLATLTNTSIR